jgi:HEAT repeat protein
MKYVPIKKRFSFFLFPFSFYLLCGCASTWDEMTSRDCNWGNVLLGKSKDPMVVLRESNDGNERYKALAALREPLQKGGSQQDQEAVMEILKNSATRDQEPICRIAAVQALAHFKDPRAPEILESAYLENLNFSREMNNLLQQQCLTSMAECGGPIALKRLVLVAKEPPSSGHEADRQETMDRRLTAVRGLAKFKEPEAAATLAYVMKSEKNIAMRDRAYESLETSTGKRYPADSPQWAAYLPAAATPSTIQPAGGVRQQ